MTPQTCSRGHEPARGVVGRDVDPRYQPRRNGAAWAVVDTRDRGRVVGVDRRLS